MDAKTNWAVTHVGIACFWNWVVVHIDDTVKVASCVVSDVIEQLMVETVVLHVDVLVERNRGEVAHCNFVLCGVFHDLSAEVG